ncbi:MAG TPA: hypothetical protein VFA50_01010 [Stellaceae bacterium]|nr:hypothetical protein [Stellaceae bacterium]
MSKKKNNKGMEGKVAAAARFGRVRGDGGDGAAARAPSPGLVARAIDYGLTRALAAIVRSSDAAIIGTTLDGIVIS